MSEENVQEASKPLEKSFYQKHEMIIFGVVILSAIALWMKPVMARFEPVDFSDNLHARSTIELTEILTEDIPLDPGQYAIGSLGDARKLGKVIITNAKGKEITSGFLNRILFSKRVKVNDVFDQYETELKKFTIYRPERISVSLSIDSEALQTNKIYLTKVGDTFTGSFKEYNFQWVISIIAGSGGLMLTYKGFRKLKKEDTN